MFIHFSRSRWLSALASLLFITGYATTAFAQWLQHPLAAWAHTSAMNQLMLKEYVSVMDAPGLTAKTREKRFLSDYGFALWKRAQFALLAAKENQQQLGDTVRLRTMLLEQQALVKKHNKKAFNDFVKFLKLDHQKKFEQVKGSFVRKEAQSFFEALGSAYALAGPPACSELKDRLKYDSLVAQSSQSSGSLTSITSLLQSMDKDRQRCLAALLLKDESGSDPAALFQAIKLEAKGTPDTTLGLLEVVWHLGERNYPETLRNLFELQKFTPLLRAPYELVQVIYSAEQKGEGTVALRGL